MPLQPSNFDNIGNFMVLINAIFFKAAESGLGLGIWLQEAQIMCVFIFNQKNGTHFLIIIMIFSFDFVSYVSFRYFCLITFG